MRDPLECDISIKNQIPIEISTLPEAELVSSSLRCPTSTVVVLAGSIEIQSYEL